ncbi:MAG: hypothetical protein HFH36_12450, partial [Lachnospiraceae bacterium]|nr:hypothetical protein [Lachnospiraceae bacterium]
SGMALAMGKLALAFTPVAAAITPFAAAVAVADAGMAALLLAVTASAAALMLMATGAAATGAGLGLAAATAMEFRAGAAAMNPAAIRASAALSRFASSFAVVSGPMSAFRVNIRATFSNLRATVASNTAATVTQFIAQWRACQQQATAVWLSYQGSFAGAWGGVHSYAVGAANRTAQQIKAAFEHMVIRVPRPRLPRVSVSYETQGIGNEKTKIPQFSISYYASGGIMTGPTLFGMVGGEKGPEGIIPLDPFWTHLDSSIAASVAGNSGALSGALHDAAAFSRMRSQASGTDSRAKELYEEITGGSTENISSYSSMASPAKIVYSPQITIQGNAEREDVQGALSISQAEFSRMMDEYNWQNGRTAMST